MEKKIAKEITKENVLAMLVKWGHNKQNANDKIEKYFDFVIRSFSPENVRQATEVIATLS